VHGAASAAAAAGDRRKAAAHRATLRTITAGADRPGRPELAEGRERAR
jgi:hypothetical protein